MSNNPKYIFRMTHSHNISQFVTDGVIYARQTKYQPQWSICYENIVKRRQHAVYNTDDKISFYFSPVTSMAYTISHGNVPLTCSNGVNQGSVNIDDVVFMVVDIETAVQKYKYQFTDQAYNKSTQIAQVYKDWHTNKNNIQMAKIPEIGYNGACKFAHNIDHEEKWMHRQDIRMAEFWIFDKLHLSDVQCFITKTQDTQNKINNILQQSLYGSIPVYYKLGVYF